MLAARALVVKMAAHHARRTLATLDHMLDGTVDSEHYQFRLSGRTGRQRPNRYQRSTRSGFNP